MFHKNRFFLFHVPKVNQNEPRVSIQFSNINLILNFCFAVCIYNCWLVFSAVPGVLPHSVCNVCVVVRLHNLPQPRNPPEKIHPLPTATRPVRLRPERPRGTHSASTHCKHVTRPLQTNERRLATKDGLLSLCLKDKRFICPHNSTTKK